MAESRNYKLQAGSTDGGGTTNASTSYSGRSSVGESVATAMATGTSYKVLGGQMSSFNTLPRVTISSYNDGTLIKDDTPTLSWSYSDKDGDTQRYYQIQVSRDNFVTSTIDTGIVESASTSFTTSILPTTEAGVNYRWRIRVSDGFDYSGWTLASSGFRLTTSKMEVPILWAKVSAAGEEIAAQLWQKCASPYMYWEYPVTGADIAGYSYAWGDTPDNDIDTVGYSYQTPVDLLGDGVRVFHLKAQNTAGVWGDTVSFEIWIDRAKPQIGIYSPTNGTIISTDVPSVSINVTDEHSGVNPNGIEMKINKASAQATYNEGTQSVVYIPKIPLREGDNVVSLEVSDYVGNKTSPLIWSFIVDTKPPAGEVIINNEDALTNSVYVTLTIDAADVTSGVKSMTISNDGVFDTEAWEPFKTRRENWTLSAISGTRKVYVKFKDNAGNESEIFSDTIELIIIAPDTIITSGPSPLTKSPDSLFTFKATTSGCVFRWKFDGEEWSQWSTETLARKLGLEEGNHYFKVQAAKDVNGNGKIDLDEIDPVPEERTWTISTKGAIKPEGPAKKPFKFWKEE